MKVQDLYNPMVKFILSSPLHPMMSGGTMLLTFTGRKSGRQFTTPISYALGGNEITLITNRKHGWWKNLQDAVPVVAKVRGHYLRGTAQVVPADESALIAAMEKVYRGMPKEKAVEFAPDAVLIKIALN